MYDLLVTGGKKLSGVITPDGNKNSVLPILCASLLTNEKIILHNVPEIDDVIKLVEIMVQIGSKIDWDKKNKDMIVDNSGVKIQEEGQMPSGMRGAIMLIAPLVYRMKRIVFHSTSRGCSLGIREIDPHLDVMKYLGANIKYSDEYLEIKLDGSFRGGKLWMDYMSVTTTESYMMAASVSEGNSVMVNAACEPHVQEVAKFLSQMGAKIVGAGSSTIHVEGVKELHGTEYTIGSDHHEITTFLAIGAMTGGRIEVKNAIPEHFPLIVRSFNKLGVNVEYKDDVAIVEENQKMEILHGYTSNFVTKIEAAPWPYFPADLLPLMMALSTKSKGEIMFWNKVYEGGLLWVTEMIKFGAKIVMCDPHRVLIIGGNPLHPATVNAPEIIRSTVALYMMAASINGESTIKNGDAIKRAHPNFVEKMNSIGVNVKWV